MAKKVTQRKSAGPRSSEAAPQDDFRDVRELWDDTPAEHQFISPVPDGLYPVEIVGGELVRSSHKKTPCYELHMLLTGDSIYSGREVDMKFWLTKSAIGRSKHILNRLGFTEFDQLLEAQPATSQALAEVVRNSGARWSEVCELYFEEPPKMSPARAAEEFTSPHVKVASHRRSA